MESDYTEYSPSLPRTVSAITVPSPSCEVLGCVLGPAENGEHSQTCLARGTSLSGGTATHLHLVTWQVHQL